MERALPYILLGMAKMGKTTTANPHDRNARRRRQALRAARHATTCARAASSSDRVLKRTGSFYYHCDWHASHYVKVMLDGLFAIGGSINGN